MDEADLTAAYRERAHLLAWLASLHPAVIAPAPDVEEPGWQILYLASSPAGWQLTWHIAPADADLFTKVEHVPVDDWRAQWDGHTTKQKYARLRSHVRLVAAGLAPLASRSWGPPPVPGVPLFSFCQQEDRAAENQLLDAEANDFEPDQKPANSNA
jgi:hypothetical protein